MSEDEKLKQLEFLMEYEKLCKRFGGIHIGACGCCDSPWITTSNSDDTNEHIKHLRKDLGKCVGV